MRERRVKLQVPQTHIPGLQEGTTRGSVWVIRGRKPPKLRWRPGEIYQIDGQLYEVICCYRLQEDPQEWRVRLEERKAIDEEHDAIGQIAEGLGLGNNTQRVVYDLFQSYTDADTYFADIPRNGDGRTVLNKTMLKAKKVADGRVVK
jgi:hypothetical protein